MIHVDQEGKKPQQGIHQNRPELIPSFTLQRIHEPTPKPKKVSEHTHTKLGSESAKADTEFQAQITYDYSIKKKVQRMSISIQRGEKTPNVQLKLLFLFKCSQTPGHTIASALPCVIKGFCCVC
jgi:hypothetical protein